MSNLKMKLKLKMSPHKILRKGQAPEWPPSWYGTVNKQRGGTSPDIPKSAIPLTEDEDQQ